MTEVPKFREKYRYNMGGVPEPSTIQEVVEAEISAAGRLDHGGVLEEVRSRQEKIAEILAFIAAELPVDKQVELATKLLWEQDDGTPPPKQQRPMKAIPEIIRKPPSGEKGSW